MKKHHIRIQYILLLALVAGIYFFLTESPIGQHYLTNPAALKYLILSFGILAPLAVIFLQFFQTIFSIIPSQITTIIAGFIFGPILGLLYSLIGAVIGSAIVFLISRKYGQKIALKFFEPVELEHFRRLFKKQKGWALFLARIAPIFPNDLVSFAAGLNKIKFREFNIISSIGFVIQMIILTYFGSELAYGKINPSLVIVTILISLMLLILLFRNKIKKTLSKDFKKIEKEVLL